MPGTPDREIVTIDGRNVVLARPQTPLANGGVIENAELLRVIALFAADLRPDNFAQADGKPMTLFAGDQVRVDLSKRSHTDMGFWHRNIDAHEIILCLRGALRWETEMGERILTPGEMLFIPRGIAHRSALCAQSEAENVLVEIKIAGPVSYVGPV